MKHIVGKQTDPWHMPVHDHDTVAEAKECERECHEQYEQHLQAKAEAEAEMRNERYWEERGAQEPEDPREVEAQMREDEMRAKAEYALREQEQDDAAYRRKIAGEEERAAAAVLDRLQGENGGRPNLDPPSDKQVRYALDLLNDREWPMSFDETDLRNMARSQVSKLIEGLRSSPRKKAAAVPIPFTLPELEAGMYRLADGRIVRVYLGQKSGRLLAKELVYKTTAVSSDADILQKGLPATWEKWGYEYLGRADRFVDGTAKRFTVEEAAEWGRKTRSCMVCARRLDVPESVDAGIGPVCRSKQEHWSA